MRKIIFMGACLLMASGALSASTAFTVYGTGFDSSGNLLTTAGSSDGNFTLTVNPDGIDSNAYLVDSIAFPLGGSWVANDTLSAWIGPQSGSSIGLPGVYTYQESFDLTAYDPSTAQITGQLAADDSVEVFLNGVDTGSGAPGYSAEIFLNGVDTGISASSVNSRTAINIVSGFNPGVNTLTVVVKNVPETSGNPTGLFAELAGGSTVPEPASFAFIGLGLAALGFLPLRRRLRS
jgi:hypothetical protein